MLLKQHVETLHATSLQTYQTILMIAIFFTTMSMISPKSGSLSAILRSYKSAVTQWCRKNGYDDFTWQPRFYDRIIRADGSLNKIREYIVNNPTKWEKNKNNSSNLWM